MDLEPVILVAIWKGKDADQERDMHEIYGGLVTDALGISLRVDSCR